MMPIRFLTDAERQIRPERIAAEYRYYVSFQLPVSGATPYQRWFSSAEIRDRYIADLPPTAVVIDRGEDLPA